MTFQFSIFGTQEDPLGNPIPKLKMTGRQQWTPKAKRYAEWKFYVQKAFMDRLQPLHRQIYDTNVLMTGKPLIIPKGKKALMTLMICWKDLRHPDPENVFGSIADALFANDKTLAGSFDFNPTPTGQGRVDVTINY